jgi:hypothetical protein
MNYTSAIDSNFGEYTIKDDILICPFWTKEFCQDLVERLENQKHQFAPDPVDMNFSTYYLNSITFDQEFTVEFKNHYLTKVVPLLKKEWFFYDLKLFSPYFLRYSLDTAVKIRSHIDIGLISCNIKLNNDFSGCDLYFPRQNFNTKDLPVGTAIFWPGVLTHRHHTDTLKRGIKYSLTCFAYDPLQKPIANSSYIEI